MIKSSHDKVTNTFYQGDYLEITKGYLVQKFQKGYLNLESIEVQVQYIFIYTIDNLDILYINHVQLYMTLRFISTLFLTL